MARVNFNNIDNYNKSNVSKWLSLKNDGDSVLVQFPFSSIDELEFYSVHKCKVRTETGKTYDLMVSCLRKDYNDPVDNCPLCKSGDAPVVPYIIPIVNYNTGEALIWNRNKTFMKELEYNIQNTPNFKSMVFKIVRIGAPGDKKTQYRLFPQQQIAPKDFSRVELVKILGDGIAEKTEQEIYQYLQTGSFPKPENGQQQNQAANNQQPVMQANAPQPQAQPQQMQQPQQGSRANFNNAAPSNQW